MRSFKLSNKKIDCVLLSNASIFYFGLTSFGIPQKRLLFNLLVPTSIGFLVVFHTFRLPSGKSTVLHIPVFVSQHKTVKNQRSKGEQPTWGKFEDLSLRIVCFDISDI